MPHMTSTKPSSQKTVQIWKPDWKPKWETPPQGNCRLCPCSSTLLHHLLRRRAARLERGSSLQHRVAWMIASRELFAPISCFLLVTDYQMFQDCCPIIQIEDGPKEIQPVRDTTRASQGILYPMISPRGKVQRRAPKPNQICTALCE